MRVAIAVDGAVDETGEPREATPALIQSIHALRQAIASSNFDGDGSDGQDATVTVVSAAALSPDQVGQVIKAMGCAPCPSLRRISASASA